MSHVITIAFADRETAERAFDRLHHMDWIMVEGGTVSLAPEENIFPINPNEWTREDRKILQRLASKTGDHGIRAGMKIYSDYIATLNL